MIRSNTLVTIGLALFALTIFGVITLVRDFVFSVTLTVIADSVSLIAVAMLWYVLPLRSRRHAVERLRVARNDVREGGRPRRPPSLSQHV